jgi:hypothetical protein
MLSLLHRDMTRKEFLAYVGSFLGLFLLSRLPWSGSSKQTHGAQIPGSYGNHVYGGTTTK